MDSEDSRDGHGDVQSSSSSSSSSSRSRHRSSSEESGPSKKDAPVHSHKQTSQRFRLSSRDSHMRLNSPAPAAKSISPSNLNEAHSDIDSPENSMPPSPKSPEGLKSPGDARSNPSSPEAPDKYVHPKSPHNPISSDKSLPGSPEEIRSRPASPDSMSQLASPSKNTEYRSQNSSPSPDRNSFPSSHARSPMKSNWSPRDKWRRHTKAEQKMVPVVNTRSRSESSQSSRSSSYNKRSSKNPATEEISDGEMESDGEEGKLNERSISNKPESKDLNLSHEDLSDVSDLDSGPEEETKEDKLKSPAPSFDDKIEMNVNGISSQSPPKQDHNKIEGSKLEKVPQEKTSNTEDGEEQLDFEAEEGECIEPQQKEQTNGENDEKDVETGDAKPRPVSRGSSLEEGEVSDEGERRPEETEPRPVCRFFSRGACTWGVSCRFLHPGVTDKGNYNMFEVVRGVAAAGSFPAPPRDSAPPESAWERGLRTAKEMLRIANKRKEQDMDFEEKKLHLSVGGVVHDPDAELAYAAAAVGASPPQRDPDLVRYSMERPYGPGAYRGRFPGRPPFDDRERFFERERVMERERMYERPPAHYDERVPVIPEEGPYHKRRVRSSREVIVQRAEGERERERERWERGAAREAPRSDAWADPWMRQEPARRRRRASSEESYSSTSSSNSSSRSSRSPGARRKRTASSSSRQRLSPSVIVRERRMANARANAMNPPAPRRRAPSPAAARQLAANPPAPLTQRHKDEQEAYGRKGRSDRKKYSRSSSSGSESSSSSSGSESESRSSSSSGSSGARRARHARLLNAAARPRANAKPSTGLAAAVATAVAGKKEPPNEKDPAAKKRSAPSPPDSPSSKRVPVSRREELLKQLKAVEDAIARKRSKI